MKKIHPTVLILGIVSFCTDLSSEMVYPLLPLYLTQVLGAGPVALGLIEGVAESTASLVKLISGFWTDYFRRRKPPVMLGYGLAALSRPLIGLAGAWPTVLFLRFLDRMGKGIRSAPRDALIADVSAGGSRGRAFGLHRAMDHAGAVLGPLIATTLMALFAWGPKNIFIASAVPGLLGVFLVWWGVRESTLQEIEDVGSLENLGHDVHNRGALCAHFKDAMSVLRNPQSRVFFLALFLFTLAKASDAFLLMKLNEKGLPGSWVGLVWSVHHVIKMLSTYWGGAWSDGAGYRKSLVIGWIFYALVYGLFALDPDLKMSVALFLIYGLYYGLEEPAERALVAKLSVKRWRGSAFGVYYLVTGLGALPASVIFGFAWQKWGTEVAFGIGSGLALVAALLVVASKEAHFRKEVQSEGA